MTGRYVGKRAPRPRESAGGSVRAEFKQEHRRLRQSTRAQEEALEGQEERPRESAEGSGRVPQARRERRRPRESARGSEKTEARREQRPKESSEGRESANSEG